MPAVEQERSSGVAAKIRALREDETLRAAMGGPVIVSGDSDYDERRRVWNADIDRRPAVIARCVSAADVAAAITFGRDQGLEITVRGGAHSFPGASVCDHGLMIDLSLLNQVSVAPEARRAQVGGGALLADMDAATQRPTVSRRRPALSATRGSVGLLSAAAWAG
jgi:FAD/FMN-containing dehydrogenase